MTQKKVQCNSCHGWGKARTGPIEGYGGRTHRYSTIRLMEMCQACKGKGYYIIQDPDSWEQCTYCRGKGQGGSCPVCKGLGRVKLDVL